MSDFDHILQEYRIEAFSQRDKGSRFERLMKVYLNTEPKYEGLFSDIWLWNEFPSRSDFGGKDTGIDIVCRTIYGDYWAVQCKCYEEKARIDKAAVDTFLSTSSKYFSDIDASGGQVKFSHRLWIDTTVNGFNSEAENTIHNQNPPVSKIGFYDLQNAAVDWQKLAEGLAGKDARKQKYPLKDHQKIAIEKANEYFTENERGKLIMACGTGKTFTSLKIAEKETGGAGLILFLVPSIALLSQTLQEWSAQCDFPIRGICICSDSQASKKQEDSGGFSVTDLALPASTDIQNIAKQYRRAKKQQAKDGGMVVVFSTYQSIDVIISVQKSLNEAEKDSFIFDLIICDEAHRTTGVTLDNAEESAFVKVHSNENITAKKRLYMTATPRLYSEAAYKKAGESNAEICSMDDTELYGQEIYRIGFGEAVEKQLLSDYKVLVLTLDESQMTAELQQSISEADVNGEIKTDDALKLIGCINALSKITNADKELFAGVDPEPMKSAVAFCQNIAVSKATVAAMNTCRDAYFTTVDEEKRNTLAVGRGAAC